MIQPVSKQQKMSWVEESERSFERDSINKGAMDSFTDSLVVRAKALQAKGVNVQEIAKQFSMDPNMMKHLLEKESKMSCACEKKQASAKEPDPLDAAEAAYNSLHNIKPRQKPDLPVASSKRILSGKGNDVTDMYGPQKQMGSERSNSIWDPNVVSRQSKTRSNDERIREENSLIAKERESAKHASRYETIDGKSLADALKEIDQRKASSVQSSSVQEAHKYNNKLPINGISMFDKGDFDRVPEKTAGEKRHEEIEKQSTAPRDRSWLERGSKSVKASDLVDNMISSMLEKKE